MSTLPTRPRRYVKSGLYCRPTRLADLPPEVAAARRERRDALVAQLGGPDEVTPAQAQLVELAVSASMQLDSVDAYLLTLPSLVDKRGKRVWPVVRDRAALSAHLQSLLRDIGVERRAARCIPLIPIWPSVPASEGGPLRLTIQRPGTGLTRVRPIN